MKQLWILRHAHAEPYAGDDTDFNRRLDEVGTVEAAAIGELVRTVNPGPLQIIASPAARTLATALAVARAVDLPAARLLEEPRIYNADRRTLVAIVRSLPTDAERVLLVGHNPGVSRLVRWLTDDERLGELRPATLVTLRADLERWSDADAGLFECTRVLRPDDARTHP